LTNKEKLELINEFILDQMKIKQTGKLIIELDMQSGGIATIKTNANVNGKLFPCQ